MSWLSIVGIIAKLGGALLGWSERQADRDLRRLEIETDLDKTEIIEKTKRVQAAGQMIRGAMEFKIFWVPWAIATIPASMWFGWGMLDTLFNGALPDVAKVPPGLQPYMDQLWSNLFLQYATGGGVAAAQTIAKAVGRRWS